MAKNRNDIRLDTVTKDDIDFLYELFQERANFPIEFRTPSENLPTYEEHKDFVCAYLNDDESNSYLAWYVIVLEKNSNNEKIGSMVLKKSEEYGLHVLMKYWDQGIGTTAIKLLFSLYPTVKFWARIKPGNKRSIHQIEKLGFTVTELIFQKV